MLMLHPLFEEHCYSTVKTGRFLVESSPVSLQWCWIFNDLITFGNEITVQQSGSLVVVFLWVSFSMGHRGVVFIRGGHVVFPC